MHGVREARLWPSFGSFEVVSHADCYGGLELGGTAIDGELGLAIEDDVHFLAVVVEVIS